MYHLFILKPLMGNIHDKFLKYALGLNNTGVPYLFARLKGVWAPYAPL